MTGSGSLEKTLAVIAGAMPGGVWLVIWNGSVTVEPCSVTRASPEYEPAEPLAIGKVETAVPLKSVKPLQTADEPNAAEAPVELNEMETGTPGSG